MPTTQPTYALGLVRAELIAIGDVLFDTGRVVRSIEVTRSGYVIMGLVDSQNREGYEGPVAPSTFIRVRI